MTIDQGFAEVMAACSHSVIEAMEMEALHRRNLIPVYQCGLRLSSAGDLALCRLMGCIPCMGIDPWAGPEGVDTARWLERDGA